MSFQIKPFGSIPSLTEERLREVEDNAGFRLPEDFRRFVLRYNGGRIDSVRIDGELPMRLHTFAYLSRIEGMGELHGSSMIDTMLERCHEAVRLGFFPFALDDTARKYLFVEHTTGRIYAGWGSDATTRDAMYPVADDIEGLLTLLANPDGRRKPAQRRGSGAQRRKRLPVQASLLGVIELFESEDSRVWWALTIEGLSIPRMPELRDVELEGIVVSADDWRLLSGTYEQSRDDQDSSVYLAGTHHPTWLERLELTARKGRTFDFSATLDIEFEDDEFAERWTGPRIVRGRCDFLGYRIEAPREWGLESILVRAGRLATLDGLSPVLMEFGVLASPA